LNRSIAKGYAGVVENPPDRFDEFTVWPHVVMESGPVRLLVLLPDPMKGYYRGPRFDWSGTVALAEWKGHTFFGSWRLPPHEPRGNDDTAGTAEELGMGPLTGNPPPVGYGDARVGETFLKIGVGRLVKIEEQAYSFGAPYEIARPAEWDVRLEAGSLVFVQEEGPVRGHALRYSKRIALDPDLPGFLVEHRLENTGAHPIEQTHYCHNFIRIDGAPVGRSYSLELPYDARLSDVAGGILEAAGRTISFARDPRDDEGFFALVSGYGTGPESNQVRVNGPRASLSISGSDPVTRFQVFGTGRTLCPEPFISISLLSGQSKSWSIVYKFEEMTI
jgi:hypothetical protein